MKIYTTSCLFFDYVIKLFFGQNTDAQTDNLDSSMTNDTIRIANDTLEYEVIIIDPGFSTWLASRSLPRNYHSQSYLENKKYTVGENGIEECYNHFVTIETFMK
jgi:hypothetical protein